MNDPLFPVEVIVTGDREALVVIRTGDPIPPEAVVGQLSLTRGQPDWASFRPNGVFLDRFHSYMQGRESSMPAWLENARVEPGENLFAIDGRHADRSGAVPPSEIVGAYRTNAQGEPVLDTFQYNPNHKLVTNEGRLSDCLNDPRLQRVIAESKRAD